MTEGRLETESRCRECLAIIKGEVTSNNLSKRRVRTRTHGVVGGRGLVAPSYPIERAVKRCINAGKNSKKVYYHYLDGRLISKKLKKGFIILSAFLAEKWQTQNFGRELVFSADL